MLLNFKIPSTVIRFGLLILIPLIFSCRPTRLVSEDAFLLDKMKVECKNRDVDKEEMESYIKQKPNKRILHVFRFHLMVYNIVNSGKERKWKKKLGGIIGEEPVVFDKIRTDKSVSHMKTYLRNKGYYEAEVDYSTRFRKKRVVIKYTINTGEPHRVISADYQIADTEIRDLVVSDTTSSLIKNGVLFDADLLQMERVRITNLMKAYGYYYFVKEYITFDADTSAGGHKVKLTVRISDPVTAEGAGTRHRRYYINRVFFYTDYDPKLAMQNREKYVGGMDSLNYRGCYFLHTGQMRFDPDVLLQSNYLMSHDLYNINNVDKTYRNLTSLKSFRLVNIQFENTGGINQLDCHIQLTPVKKQSYQVEVEGTNSSGNLGVAGNLIYQNRNIFGSAEILDFKIRGAMERQSVIIEANDDQLQEYLPFNTVEFGGETRLHFHQFLLPFRSERFIKNHNPKTNISLSYNFQQRPDYTRTISNISFGYYWEGNRNLKHFINPVELNYVNLPFITRRFSRSIRGTFLENSYTNHTVGVTSYSFIFQDPTLNKKRDIVYLRGTAESAGSLLTGINELRKADKVDGYYQLLGTQYAQFIKAELEFRYLRKLTQGTKVAYRIFGGFGYPYGNTDVLPFEKRYFCGGANSVRAWAVRSLGPGSFNDSASGVFNQTADIKLEANLEYRFRMFWLLEGALFVDAGNIWDIRSQTERPGASFNPALFYNDIAVGYGIGLRFDFTFFVFRVDWGLKGRDPSQPAGNKWVMWHKNQLPADYNFHAFNIGIGYPF